jgi:BMFP domain-containing protein YqiC
MQTENRLFDDLARMANGAINTLSGVREEIESRLRERVERWLAEMDMVPREEFEAIKELAQKARAEQEDLTAKVAALEQKLAAMSAAPEAAPRSRKATARPTAKAAPEPKSEPKAGPATRRRTTKAKPAD